MTHAERSTLSRRALLAGTAGAATVALIGAGAEPARMAFTGARIIDGNGGPPVDGGTILAQAGQIVALGDARAVGVPADARRIDLRGKTITPLLIDAHKHRRYRLRHVSDDGPRDLRGDHR